MARKSVKSVEVVKSTPTDKVDVTSERHTKFITEVKLMEAEGKFQGMRDATRPLPFFIDKKVIEEAKKADESMCVIAIGTAPCFLNEVVVSVGSFVVKILDKDTGWVTRYTVQQVVAHAIKSFDLTGIWPLNPGKYVLKVPTGEGCLTENQSEEVKIRKAERFKKSYERIKAGKTAKKPRTKASSVRPRVVTILRNPKSQ